MRLFATCVNSGVMESKLARAISWEQDAAGLSLREEDFASANHGRIYASATCCATTVLVSPVHSLLINAASVSRPVCSWSSSFGSIGGSSAANGARVTPRMRTDYPRTSPNPENGHRKARHINGKSSLLAYQSPGICRGWNTRF